MATQHPEQDSLVASFGEHGRIQLRVYSGGGSPAEIHIIEGYAPRADGVRESGGLLITTVPYDGSTSTTAFAAEFAKMVQDAGLVGRPYQESPETRSQIREIAGKAAKAVNLGPLAGTSA